MRRCERGFSLVEILVAVGIVAMLAAGAVAAALGTRPGALASATTGFDALLDAARTASRAAPGVRVTFAPLPGDPKGVRVRLAGGGLASAPLDAHVAVTETESLGAPAFALALHQDGAVGGIAGTSAVERGCPASGAFRLVFRAGAGSAQRFVPCRVAPASTAAATLLPPPAGSTPSPPAATCADASCAFAVAPPNATGACPPRFFFISASACADPPIAAAPASLLFALPGAPAGSVALHEDWYAGAFVATASTCGGAVALAGGGNGPDATLSVAPLAPARCSIEIDDDHGGAATVGIVTYGPLAVSPARLTFAAPDAPASGVAVSEAAYAGTIAVSGCAGYASASPASFAVPPGGVATVAVAPAQVAACTLTFADDHGGAASVAVVVNAPAVTQIVCASDPRAGTTDRSTIPWTSYVGVTTSPPCAAVLRTASAGSVGWDWEPRACDGTRGCSGGGVVNGYWTASGTFASFAVAVAPVSAASALTVTVTNVVDGGGGNPTARISAAPFAVSGTRASTAGPELPATWDGARWLFWSPSATAGTYELALLPAGTPPLVPPKIGTTDASTFTYAIGQFP